MAVATGPVGPVSTGPLFKRKVNEYSITTTHLIDYFALTQSLDLLTRRGRHMLNGSERVSTDALQRAPSSQARFCISQMFFREIKTGALLCAEPMVQYLAVPTL